MTFNATNHLGEGISDSDRLQAEAAARAALPTAGFLTAPQLEKLTGTPASTWRYWAHIGSGPPSFKIGRRRVWRLSTVMAWLEAQENA
jgi:predicted DNA-binding transcriptional regulator AlpA